MTKFNPKQYQGKDKIYVAIPSAPRVSRLWVWSERHKEYRTPTEQKPYMARRWESDASGRRKRGYRFFETLDEAREWQLDSTEPIAPVPAAQRGRGGILFRDLVDEWKRRRFPSMEASTQIRYDDIIRMYFGSLMDLGIRDFTPRTLDAWLDELKDPKNWTMKSRKRTSFDHELSLLSTILKYYVNYHDDEEFQFPIKQRHKDAVWLKRKPKAKDKHLPETDFLKFREQLVQLKNGETLAALATVQYYQALRISEAAGIHWEDVQFDPAAPERSRLKIKRYVFFSRKKGVPSTVKVGFKNADSSDNEGIKEQPLFPESYSALMQLYRDGAKGLIFANRGTHFPYNTLQVRYTEAFKRAGLPHSGTHIMRHGGCSRLFDERGDLGVAKQILGNSTLRSVEVYARRSKTALTDVAKQHWERKGLRLVVSGGSVNE